MPVGCEIISTAGHGASYWSQAARIDVRLEDGQDKTFFIKLTRSAQMVEGEYTAMKALREIMPEIVPQPLAFGTFEDDPTRHFFLCEFVDLYEDLPDVVDFCRDVATLHRRSIEKSTTGMFGFDLNTCNGSYPQDNTWSISWEAFFTNSMRKKVDTEIQIHGHCEAYDELLPDFFDKVLPALLRPLETDGRNIRPCLVHGDLWDGNTGIHTESGRAYIFDSAAFWGHNEYELGLWRAERFKFKGAYVEEYFKNFPQAPPENMWDDRQLLYSISFDIVDSILFKSTPNFRDIAIEGIRKLVDKYSAGYTGNAERKDIALARTPTLSSANTEIIPAKAEELDTTSGSPHILDPRPSIETVLQLDTSLDNETSQPETSPIVEELTRSDIKLGESAISPPISTIVTNSEILYGLRR